MVYKVFVNNKPIFLTSSLTEDCIPIEDISLRDLLKKISKKKTPHLSLYHKDSQKLIPLFKEKLSTVVAAGGLVRNENNEVLFIKRNGKWDLPKGRVERKEPIEDAAIRETEEETGVENLKITKPLQITYHLFKRNGETKLKETHWFEMFTVYNGKLVPQTNEGITKVRWKNEKKAQLALRKSYANIRELFVDR